MSSHWDFAVILTFVQHYFEIIQHLYDKRIWIFYAPPHSDATLFLTGCQIPLHLCFSVSESGVIKYANSLPLEECAFIHKRFKHLETKSFVYKVIAWAIILTSYRLPPQFTNLSVPRWHPSILQVHQEKIKMFLFYQWTCCDCDFV